MDLFVDKSYYPVAKEFKKINILICGGDSI